MGNIVQVEYTIEVPHSTESEETPPEEKKKLTKEEVKKENIFKDLNKAIDQMNQNKDLQINNEKWNRDLLKSLGVFIKTYSSIEKTFSKQYDLMLKYQREAGVKLSTSKSISVICKVIIKGLDSKNKDGKPDTDQFKVLSQSLHTLVNYSDCTPEVIYNIAQEPDFLENIRNILTSHMKKETKVYDEEIIKWCLTIYYNISKVDTNIPHLRRLDIVPVFKFFLDAQVEISRLTALSTLANIVDDKESTEVLQGKSDVIAFLLKKLGLALKNPSHRHLGWSAQECTRTVCRLARNDANKTLLVQMGCLPHLVELAKSGNKEEKREAVGAIQILSLKKDNCMKIVDDTSLKIVDMLIEIKAYSSDKAVRKAIDITFYNLREELQKKDNYKDLVSNCAPGNSQSDEMSGKIIQAGKGHIMISYNWGHKTELIKIKDVLKEKDYDLWMDIENMSGSTTEAMAKAVEDAHVILICMSQKYKDSANCKAEAEYAFNLKKKIISLKMENAYIPDGWLEVVVSGKHCIDFSGKYPFEAKVLDLIDEIVKLYGDEDTKPVAVPIKIIPVATSCESIITPEFLHICFQKIMHISSLLTLAMCIEGLRTLVHMTPIANIIFFSHILFH
ncbi:hypothetical protein ACJMK2_004539 [Sinanodonta woodiana]|uniref:TIR domain-containing protein n=1 Tax=Sinanodonta woodiana TaxID=1069815 RepID=A0ABD3Y322_SINWO